MRTVANGISSEPQRPFLQSSIAEATVQSIFRTKVNSALHFRMKGPVLIPLMNLSLAFIPVAIVIFFLFRWSLKGTTAVYAIARMLVQLFLIGYVLAYIFRAEHVAIVISVLAVMLAMAGWIAMRPLAKRTAKMYWKALLSLLAGGMTTLILIVLGVLDLDPWFEPRYVIPLAGMIFANSMNAISLAAERFTAERDRGESYIDARDTALSAALIPITNSMFAVGLVSLPGMMTGQILSGVTPLLAARYQIMVMAMLFGAAGLAAITFLALQRDDSSETATV
jgi:putative ABC transport system permease protein